MGKNSHYDFVLVSVPIHAIVHGMAQAQVAKLPLPLRIITLGLARRNESHIMLEIQPARRVILVAAYT